MTARVPARQSRNQKKSKGPPLTSPPALGRAARGPAPLVTVFRRATSTYENICAGCEGVREKILIRGNDLFEFDEQSGVRLKQAVNRFFQLFAAERTEIKV